MKMRIWWAFWMGRTCSYWGKPKIRSSRNPLVVERLGPAEEGSYIGPMLPALKEWDVVCEALGSGRQVIVIRKGGIAEGKDGLRFEHEEFVLLPTFFHQQAERVVPDAAFSARQSGAEDDQDPVEIRHAATLVWHKVVTDRAALARLQTFHILTPEEVEARFNQKPEPGVQVALLRVYRLDPPQRVAWQKSFGGCRSWAEMDTDLESCSRVSVLSDERFAELERELREILG